MQGASIIRNRGKIQATVDNARAMTSSSPSLAELAKSYAFARTRAPRSLADLPTSTPEAEAFAKELKSQGYRFVGPTSVYAFMQEHDGQLCDTALAQGVVLCSPFTLFAVLGVVRRAVDCFLLERASDEILDALTGFSQQWQRFSDHVDKLGKQLGTVQGTYDELATTRRRQLEKRLDEIDAIRTRRGLSGPDDDRGGKAGDVGEAKTPVLREVSAL